MLSSETHTKRQATQNGFLPSLLGDGDKIIDIMFGEEKIYCSRTTRAAKEEQNLLYRQGRPSEATKEGHLLFVLFESPFI